VSQAADLIEEHFNQAVEPLEQARIVAREARKLPNLPQYIDQDLTRVISEIDRAIGGSQWDMVGRIRAGIQNIRKDLPADVLKTEQENAKHGTTPALI
jgi:hypothetical protein